MYKVELKTTSFSVGNFTSYFIAKSVYTLANTAAITVYRKDYAELTAFKKRLQRNLPVQLFIDGELVLSGIIAEISPEYRRGIPCLTVKINSPASKMVDASTGAGKTYLKQTAAAIAADIVSGFGLEFNYTGSKQDIIQEFTVSSCDLADVVLNQLAQISNCLIYSETSGRVIMEEKCSRKKTSSALITGENIIDIYKYDNVYNQFSAVCLHNQQPLKDELTLENIVNNSLTGQSQGTEREKHLTADILNLTALNGQIQEFEESCFDFRVVGSSFKDTENNIFRLNQPIIVKDEWIDVDGTFRIARVELSGSEESYTATLDLEELA